MPLALVPMLLALALMLLALALIVMPLALVLMPLALALMRPRRILSTRPPSNYCSCRPPRLTHKNQSYNAS